MQTKPFKDGTPMFEIILDGWARGLQVEQTWNELIDMGFDKVSSFDIIKIRELLEDKMQRHFADEEAKETAAFKASFGVFN